MNFKALFLGKGRVNRRQFIILLLILIVSTITIGILTDDFEGNNYVRGFGIIFSGILDFLIVGLILRRGHDIGFGRIVSILVCLLLIILFGYDWLFFPPIEKYIDLVWFDFFWSNFYDNILYLLDYLLIIFWIYCVLMTLLRGNNGSNKYGKKPKNIKNIKGIFSYWINNK